MNLTRAEWKAGLLFANIHTVQHLYYRLLPPLIPVLAVELEMPLWRLGLFVSIYMFSGGICQAPMGILSDRYDRRYLLYPALTLMPLGYVVFALSPVLSAGIRSVPLFGYAFSGTFLVMAVGMFISGMGHSSIHPIGYPLVTSNVRPETKGTALGIWGSSSKFGDAISPLLVGAFILVLTWDQVMLVLGAIGIANALLIALFLERGSFETVSPVADDTADADDFSLTEELRTFLFPFATIMLFFFSVMFANNGLSTYLPVFVADTYEYTFDVFGATFGRESVANVYLSIYLLTGGVAMLFTGRLTDTYDHRTIIVGLMATATLGLVVLSYVPLTPLTLAVVVALLGTSISGINPARDALISDIAPDQYEGRTFGYLWTMAMIVASTYPTLIGYMAETIGIIDSFKYLAVGTVAALIVIGSMYSRRVYVPRPAES